MIQSLAELLGITYTTLVVALGAGVLGVSSGALGSFAVLRQRSLMGDALSHSALPGVAIGFMVTGSKDPAALLVGAAFAGLVAALLMVGMEQTPRITSDVAIGVILSTFFALGIVLLTYLAHTNNSNQAGLETYLFGQAAGLLARDLVLMVSLSTIAIAVVIAAFRPLKTTLFDVRFAASVGLRVRRYEILVTVLLVVAILIGVRTVGSILMVAMLIVPTATARQFSSRLAIVIPLACVVGAMVGVSGSLISTRAALPTGPVIALVGLLFVMFAVIFAPSRGVAWNARAVMKRRHQRTDQSSLLTLGRNPDGVDVAALHRASLRRLRRQQLAREKYASVRLTPEGQREFERVRAERKLWSLWLIHGWRLELPDAQEPTPETVRQVLGDTLVTELQSHDRRITA